MRDNRTSKHYYVKEKVLASMKQVSYNMQVTLRANSGFVLEASCECKSSLLGRCSHMGAVLVAVSCVGHDTAKQHVTHLIKRKPEEVVAQSLLHHDGVGTYRLRCGERPGLCLPQKTVANFPGLP